MENYSKSLKNLNYILIKKDKVFLDLDDYAKSKTIEIFKKIQKKELFFELLFENIDWISKDKIYL